jgi:hypothetical protein
VHLKYFCGVGHMDELELRSQQQAIEPWLIDGTPVAAGPLASDEPCAIDSAKLLAIAEDASGKLDLTVRDEPLAAVRSRAAVSMSLLEAEAAGLVKASYGSGQVEVVSLVKRPLTITVSGKKRIALLTARLTDEGEKDARSFKPVRGPVVLGFKPGAAPVATRKGKALKGRAPDRRPPVTRVRVKKRGKTALLTFRARDASGVRQTLVIVGKAKPRRAGRKPIRVPAKKLRTVRYASADIFGNVEKTRRLR